MAPRKKPDDGGHVSVDQQLHNPTLPIVRERKRPLVPKRNESSDVVELVYRFLGNLAAVENGETDIVAGPPRIRFDANSRSQRRRTGGSSRRRVRSPTPYAWDRVAASSSEPRSPADSDDSRDEPRKPVGADSVANLLTAGDKLEKDPSIIQKINRYIQDGINEGKRRAKLYVQKALLFALEMGYLVPADREGVLLRVASNLALRRPGPEKLAGRKPVKPRRRSGGKRRGRSVQRLSRRRTKLYRETVEGSADRETKGSERSREGSNRRESLPRSARDEPRAGGTRAGAESAEVERKPGSRGGSSFKSNP